MHNRFFSGLLSVRRVPFLIVLMTLLSYATTTSNFSLCGCLTVLCVAVAREKLSRSRRDEEMWSHKRETLCYIVLCLLVYYLAKFSAQILKQSGYVRVVCDEWICCNRIHPMCVPKCVEAKNQLKSIRFACWKLEQFTYIFESSEDIK